MKHYTTLIALLVSLCTYSQSGYYIDRSTLKPAHFTTPHYNAGNSSRSEQINMLLDYGSVDQQYAYNIAGDNYQLYSWPLNKNYASNDNLTLKTAAVRFNVLKQIDSAGIDFISYPLQAAQINIDSIAIIYAYERSLLSVTQDTLIISILKGSTFGIADTGISATLTGQVLWADTTYLINSVGITSFSSLSRYPNISLAHGEHFVIKVDFAGDTANKFLIGAGGRDACNTSCLFEPSWVGLNSYSYMNYTGNNGLGTNVSGINRFLADCNSDGIAPTEGACESFYQQNISFLAYINANIDLTAYFDNDTFAFCDGATTLKPKVAGADGPVTYSWSPSIGLSSDTAAEPTVAIPVNPILYTLTINDGVNTATTTILVNTDQSICQLMDTFAGRVFFDQNNNLQYDSGEYVMANATVRAMHKTVQTDADGKYLVRLVHTGGSYGISLENLGFPYMFNVPVSGNYTGVFNGNHLDYDFAIRSTGDSTNLFLVMANPAIPPRPGFYSSINTLCFNPVNIPVTGVLEMVYDSLQTYTTAVPVPDNVDVTNRKITWNVSLGALTYTTFSVEMYTPPTVPLGTVLRSHSYLHINEALAEIDTNDNHAVFEEAVVGSYDPNDKSVSPVGKGPDGRMLPGQNLQYTIRFQNTGTFYAENVAVRDTIDTDLDLSTFRMLSARHRYEYTFNGNVITWNFNQIMLLDSHTNEPASHGYISYAIAMKDDVVDLSPISNTAYIYFDFNEAIVTNTTLSTVDYNLNVGIGEASAGASVKVYPNPFKGETNFVLGAGCNGASLKVYNLTGQLVDQKNNLTEGVYTYSAKNLATGMYNYMIVNSAGIVAKGKIVAE